MTLCPRCNSGAAQRFTTTDLNRRTGQQEFTYYQCAVCGLIFLHPIPADLSPYYQGEYYSLPQHANDLAPYLSAERYKLDLIRPYAPGGRLFEVGPAVGLFAYLAKQAGYQVEVMEMDNACCDFLETKLGIPAIHTGDIRAALAGRGQYNVIALWHVIEHLPDPWSALPVLADHLAPGGMLVIAAPNPDAFQFGLFGRWWTHVDAPRHLELIPAQLLIDDCAKVDLRLALKTSADAGGRQWDRFGWKMSLHNQASDPRVKRILRGVGILASIAALPFDRMSMRGSAYTLIFTKDAV